MYTIEQGMANIYADPMVVAIGGIITYLVGFLVYGTTLWMQVKNDACPMYFWQHCWYFGHDLTFALLFHQWFFEIGWWLFELLCIGCVCFVFIEIFALYRSVKHERDFLFNRYRHDGTPVPVKNAFLRGLVCYGLGFAFFSLTRLVIGDPLCLVLMASTNIIMAIFPSYLLEQVGKSLPGYKFLSIMTVVTVITTFLPAGIGWFTTVVDALNSPAYYLLGAISLAYSIRFVYQAFTYPKISAEDYHEIRKQQDELTAKASAL